MTTTAVMGVDPGVNGGIAVLRGDGTVAYLRALKPSMTREDLAQVVRAAVCTLKFEGGLVAYLEKVGYRPSDGGQGAFTFGRIYGGLEQAIIANGGIIQDVYPQMWQAGMECLTGGNKNVSKQRAIELFPQEKITHATADALLIAEWGRRRFLTPSASL